MKAGEPMITLCMIVKDEAENLPRCLQSVRGLVDEIVVVDTGSTDATVAIAAGYGARLLHHVWSDDFAAARNVGLEAATGDWILVLDADEELHPDDRPLLRPLCRDAGEGVEAFSLVLINLTDGGGTIETEYSYDVDLWRNRPQYRFESALHEQIIPSIRACRPEARVEHSPVRVLHYGYLTAARAGRRKSDRNLRLARKLVEEHPDDPFYRFNLGVELQGLQDYAEAVAQFERVRSTLTWWPGWSAKLFKCLASCLIGLKEWARVESALRQGLAIFSGFTDLVFLRGLACQEQGDHARAVAFFRLAATMGPARELGAWPGLGGHRAYEALARSCAALGRVAEAACAYEAAFAAKPDWTLPLAEMVKALSGHLPDPQLCERLGACFDLADPQQRVRMADALLAGERADLALSLLDRQPVGESAAARYLRALACLRLGRYGEAAAALEPLPREWQGLAAPVSLVAAACHRGRLAVAELAAEQGLEPVHLREAAQLCLKEAGFWERAGTTGRGAYVPEGATGDEHA